MSLSSHRWVADESSLAELASRLRSSSSHALDTESNSGFAYRERLCLLQFRVDEETWAVDPLALPGGKQALDPLRDVLESPEHTTLLHGGEFDVGCLKRDFGVALRGVWDSQQAALFLGREKTGYGALVDEICGVRLDKAFALHDWARRPVEPRPLQYALDDVLYLGRVVESLRQEVAAADLVEEVEIACRVVESATWSSASFEPAGLWRIKGVGRLPRPALPTMTALYTWREKTAERLDRPPGRLLNNRVLLAAARNPPTRIDELRRLGVARAVINSDGAELLETIRQARIDPPDVPPRVVREPRSSEARRREERLREFRRIEAERRSVPQQVVLPAVALQHLARHGTADLDAVPQMGAKRIGLYGHRLREICAEPQQGS